MSVLPGYVRFDDGSRVKINLNSRSKSDIKHLKRKLVNELDQVRSLRKKLDSKDKFQSSFNDNFNNRITGNSGGDGIGTLHRVNSEVSYVGQTNSRPLFGNEKKKNPVNSKKNLKQCGGGGGQGVVVEFSKDLVKESRELLEKLMKHQYGWVFNVPVDVKKLKLHDYLKIIKHPMDLGTVKSRLSKNWYKTPKEFAEDVRLTFNNAMKYNEKGQDVHAMADTLLKIFEENWANVKDKTNPDKREMGYGASLQTPASKRAPGPHASSPTSASASACAPSPAPLPQTMPLETRTLGGTDSLMKAANSATDQGRASVSKKPKKDTDKRKMTYEEKQELSISLQNLPSEKLESVVQIIRKRNPGLFQQEDEIEVDIDSFDNETLWELHSYVNNYQKSISKNDREAKVVLQDRKEADHNMLGTKLTSATAEAPKDLGSGNNHLEFPRILCCLHSGFSFAGSLWHSNHYALNSKTFWFEAVQVTLPASSPIKEHKQGHCMSRSSSSSSFGCGSRSSSNGSDIDSSSGSGSDAEASFALNAAGGVIYHMPTFLAKYLTRYYRDPVALLLTTRGRAFCSNRTNWMEGRHCWCRKIIIVMYSTSWSVCFSGTHPTILWDADFARENNSFTL
ncbi:hypothetical protein SADUNF_Sadunf11G0065800 [Salix dunnii]|uniref:Uncharacterized protein n=1 Tax=Salix dunnii TaxID=1413687 RepID=A0A835JNG6_9ROSI|nr:hypothetical protein SADUNF_Sadunf11G0065800 [Salix dunnii]